MEHELIGVRIISSEEGYAGFHKGGDEGYIACETIEFCDDQSRLLLFAQIDSGFELWTVVATATFDFDKFSERSRRHAIEVLANRMTLRFQAEPTVTLLSCTHSKITDV